MNATQDKFLNKYPGVIEVTVDPGTISIADDFSDVATAKTAIDALTFDRLSSVTDLQIAESYSESTVVDTDDNGNIYRSVLPAVTVTGNYYEVGNPDVLATIVNKFVINDVSSQYVGSKVNNTELPKLIVRITSTLPGGKVKQVYVRDAGFTGELVNAFSDPNRVGDLPNSAFEFTANKGADTFTFTDDLPA